MTYTYYRRYQPSQRRRPKKPSSFGSFFKLVLILGLIVLVIRFVFGFFSSRAEERKDELTLSVYKGEASLQLFGQDEWKGAASSEIIHIGDRIKTGDDSWITLELQNGTLLRLDENSILHFWEYEENGTDESFLFELEQGRMWMDQIPKEEGDLLLVVQTDVLNVESLTGQYFLSNQADNEYVYPIESSMIVDFVERGDEDRVIETTSLNVGERSLITDEVERALLNREDVELVESIGVEIPQDNFVRWSVGSLELPEPETVEEAEEEEVVEEEETPKEETSEEEPPEEEESVEEEPAAESLSIQILSPSAGESITKDAIAIEGIVSSGFAQSVEVTWSGNGVPYQLGFFVPGDESFRYVADVEYGNFSAGENTYTITAYDVDGNSVSQVLVINGEF